MKNIELAEKLIERAKKLGAEEAEAYVSQSTTAQIQINNSEADTVNYRKSGGFGLRILLDGKLGFASANRMSLDGADDLIKKLVANTTKHTPDEHNLLPKPNSSDNGADDQFDLYDDNILASPIEDKIKNALQIDSAARLTDPRIVNMGWIQYGDSAEEFAIASTLGIRGESRRSYVYGYALPTAMAMDEKGQPDPTTVQTGAALDVFSHLSEFDPKSLGVKAARRALRMIGAGQCPSGEMDVLLPPETGSSFIGLVADMLSADLIQKKKSIFAGKLNEQVASKKVTIIDDGRLIGGLASAMVDGEGNPTTTKEIIKDGQLTQFLYDSYTAHRGNTTSTGNAARSAFDCRPTISPTNFYLKPGLLSPEEILATVANGLFLTEVSGLHASVDKVTGNFSIPGKGLMISGGELAQPVTGLTVSGNIFDFFKSVSIVGNDLTWELQSHVIGAPTIKVDGLKITG